MTTDTTATTASPLPIDPATATPQQVIDLMMEIWDADPHRLYEAWHNARKVMRAIGATQVGNPNGADEERWIGYRLPAGGRVFVMQGGQGIRLPVWRTLR